METNDTTAHPIDLSLITKEGLKSLLSSRFIKGTGPVYAARIVDKFGLDIWDPDINIGSALKEIPGLGEGKIEEIVKSVEDLKYPLSTLALMFSAGLSEIEVEKIASHYKKRLTQAILSDPYDMVENAWKVSFFTADRLGRWLGVGKDDPGRLRGALLTAIKFYAEKGNMFATEAQAVKTAAALSDSTEEKVRNQIEPLVEEGRIVKNNEGLYLPPYYIAEEGAAEKLSKLIRNAPPLENIFDLPATDITGNPLNKGQIEAIQSVLRHPVTVITGGPGTGKTTAVRGLIRLFEDMDKKVVLTAPTGRAAKRMSDLAGAEAKTIHRLLGYSMGRGYRNRKFDADLLVIDEASMLEQVLFNHLLDAVSEDTRIVLVGDTHQLPSIGAGDVLNQLIQSGTVPVINLSENFRQKAGSGIASTAEEIKKGKKPLASHGEDFIMLEENGEKAIKERLLSLLTKEIPEMCGVDSKHIQIVTPQKEGSLGSRQLNEEIQEWVNPDGKEIKRGRKKFRLGDRVMQSSNSSERNVYNGETGWISDVDMENEILEVTFYDGKKLRYGRDRFKELTLAYATTVHKLQGAETDYMVMLLTSEHRPLLYRNLLYTGISRARKLCVLVGEGKALDTAVRNDSPNVRNSNFKLRLQKGVGK